MAAAVEGRAEPNLHEPIDQPIAQHVAGETEHVQIVVAAAQFGGDVVVARGGSNSRNLVGGNAHPQPGAADQNSPIDFARRDLSAHFCGNVRIVDRLGTRLADVDHFLAEAHEQLDQFPSHFHASMVTPDRNPHRFAFC